jgi:uncharacterized membrane protein YhhN
VWILVLFIVIFIWDIINIKNKNKKGRYFSKSLLMPILIVYYITAAKHISIYVIAALAAGFLGDVFLLNERKPLYLELGIASFMAGQIFYITSFIKASAGINQIPLWCLIFLIPYVLYGVYNYRILRNKLGAMKIPAIVYFAVLILMSFTCLAVLVSGKTQLIPAFIGSLLFVASDTILAYNIFSSEKEYADIYIMSTYAAAQLLIVLGM